MNFHQLSEKITAAILGFLFFACLGFQLYALNKGFDITDEGYNLQLVSSRFVGISNTYFYEVVQFMFGWLPQSLLVNRLVSTVLLFGSSIFFLVAAFRYFAISFSAAAVFFCLLSIPFAATFDSVTLSYNNTTAAFTLLSVSCYFMWHTITPEKKYTQFFLLILSGCFAAMVCVTKITSGLALSATIPVMILMTIPQRLKHVGLFIWGWLGYQLLQGIWFTPFYVQVKNIMLAGDLFAQMDAKYQGFTLINDAYVFVKTQASLGLRFLVFFVLAKFIPVKSIRVIWLLLALAFLYYGFYMSEFQLTGLIYVLCSVMCAAYVLVAVANKNVLDTLRKKWKLILHGSLLFAVPLIVVIGTNNVYYHNYIFATIPLAVVAVVAFQQVEIAWFKQLTLVVVGCCVTYVCYTKILWHPYRILPLTQQTETMEGVPVLRNIRLDIGSINRYQRLKTYLTNHGFTSEHGLICLGKMQGIPYLLQASSPGGVMFSPSFRELYLRNLAADTNTYAQPYFVLSDYRLADSLDVVTNNWEKRFTQTLSNRLHLHTNWKLKDSIAFETAPLGVLYLYAMELNQSR